MLSYWRRMSQWGQDALVAAALAVAWGIGLAVLNRYYSLLVEWQAYLVAGIFLVFSVAFVRRFPRTTLATVCALYPFIYNLILDHEQTFNALHSEVHLAPLLVVGYQAAAGGVRVPTCLFFTLGSLATLMVFIPTAASLAISVLGADALPITGFPRTLPGLIRYIDLSLFVAAAALVGGMVLLGASSRRRRSSMILLEQRNAELVRLRADAAERAAAAERTRIARDLHDVVSHHMSAVVIRAQAADRVAEQRPEELREAVRWIAASGKEALTAMRETVRVLNTASPGGSADTAPVPDLDDVVRMGERLKAVGVDVVLDLPVRQSASATQVTAVRIIQEALTNVMVHSRATSARVTWHSAPEGELLTVDDNGRTGPPPPNVLATAKREESGRGNGLIGMRERSAAVGGTLSVGPSPLGGWRIQAWLPAPAR
ncbi:histidine kinase [Kribbella sp. NBC_01245]|uniref:sensor histidine kinase n=1 Tax=Kribbella sp. NBC_01245 TaxID=2903578 RepID=UPI002E2DB551|nr:histidine kinase [Kribbella sp. NBC_01245]